MDPAEPCSIRPAHPGDAARLALLSEQLGYPITATEAALRLAALARDPNAAVLVVVVGDEVRGWIALHERHLLHGERHCEISGLVVDEQVRGQRLGSQLIAAAEQWTRARGIELLRVRSNSTRTRTHAYYLKLGFSAGKISHNFYKQLAP